jgi:short-subunit dehydrogenase
MSARAIRAPRSAAPSPAPGRSHQRRLCDALFSNAGVAIGGKLTDADIREVAWLMEVNVVGTVRTIQAFMPHLLHRAEAGGRPRIILTGSENSIGLPSTGEMTAYTATKHAVLALADGLQRDLAGSGVGVSIFCPGLVNTRLWDSRSTRQARYGGAEAVDAERASMLETLVAQHGQDPAQTARLCLEGIDRDEFLIITDPHIRFLADARREQVYAALDRLDASLAN